MITYGRNWQTGIEYSFGFQGCLKDNEIKINGNIYSTLYRELDTRLGRWFAMDPKTRTSPWESPYVSMGNNPIWKIDPEGDEYFVKVGLFKKLKYNSTDGKFYTRKGVEYQGGDEFVNRVQRALKELSTTQIGNALVDEISNDKGKIIIKNEISPQGGGKFVANFFKTGGVIYAEALMQEAPMLDGIRMLGHESFHAFQMLHGSGGPSINSEVEAYLFEAVFLKEYSNQGYANLKNNNNPEEAKIFETGFNDVLNNIDCITPKQMVSFNEAVATFQKGSSLNRQSSSGGKLYDDFKIKQNYHIVIDRLYSTLLIAGH